MLGMWSHEADQRETNPFVIYFGENILTTSDLNFQRIRILNTIIVNSIREDLRQFHNISLMGGINWELILTVYYRELFKLLLERSQWKHLRANIESNLYYAHNFACDNATRETRDLFKAIDAGYWNFHDFSIIRYRLVSIVICNGFVDTSVDQNIIKIMFLLKRWWPYI